MARCRFVQPEVVRLPLSDGDWIDVKRRLTVGEERAAMQQLVGEISPEGWRRPNFELVGIAEAAMYIVAWSFVDAQGHQTRFSLQALQNLDPESYREIEAAIEAHAKQVQEDLASKNGHGGAISPVPISPSAA